MSQLGVGVMISMLTSNKEQVKIFKEACGKTIDDIQVQGDHLKIGFTDGTGIQLYDDGQSCCEHRYMVPSVESTDYFVGAQLTGAAIKDAPEEEDEYGGVHEVQFLQITTSKGDFSVANHNEHNGYYGGFAIKVTLWVRKED